MQIISIAKVTEDRTEIASVTLEGVFGYKPLDPTLFGTCEGMERVRSS